MNTILDDISAVIGFSATQRIAAWYGDLSLYVPASIDPEHPLMKLIGPMCFAALVKEFPKKSLQIPYGRLSEDVRHRQIAEMTVLGSTTEAVAVHVNLTPKRVAQIKDDLREKGLLKLVAKRRQETARKNRWVKSAGDLPSTDFSGQKLPGKAPSDFSGQKLPGKAPHPPLPNGVDVERRAMLRSPVDAAAAVIGGTWMKQG